MSVPGPEGSPGPEVKAAFVEVPASSANLGPGFDALAVALELRLRVTMRWVTTPSGSGGWPPSLAGLFVTGEGADEIDRTPAVNRVWQAAMRVFEAAAPPAWAGRFAVEIEEANAIPLAAGLGSSAAAAVAGLWGANALVGSPLAYERLLAMAAAIEGHADNAAAAAVGGFVTCRMGSAGVTAVRVPVPRGELVAVVAVPPLKLSTEQARRVLPAEVPLGDAVFNVGGTSLVVAALTTGRFELLREAMADRLHQPYRQALVPGLDAVMRAAIEAGAYGASLSGSGPSVLALCRPQQAEVVGDAMARAFSRYGLNARRFTLEPASEGARLRIRRDSSEGEQGSV